MGLKTRMVSLVLVLLLFASSAAIASSLQGRVIVIDPGHGGSEPGAIGPTGLVEKDINLDVSLSLRDLLVENGATVYMTRETDKDLSLQARVDFTHKHSPDLFISVHHNAMPNSPNESFIEVYHSARDRGQGRIFGQILYEELVKTTGIPGKTMGPGNYYLLNRILEFPAIIGEAYYISNPESEQILGDPQVLYAQAEAYFRAIDTFFSMGVAKTSLVSPREGEIVEKLELEAMLTTDKGSIDPQTIEVTLNGERVAHQFDSTGRLLVSADEARSSGEYTFRVRMGDTLGAVASYVERQVILSNKAKVANWEVEPQQIPADSKARVEAVVSLTDQWGFPVLDGRKVDVEITGGTLHNQAITTEKGIVRFTFSPIAGSTSATLSMTIDGLISTTLVRFDLSDQALVSGRVTVGGEPVQNALINGQPVNDDGRYYYLANEGHVTLKVDAEGFYPISHQLNVEHGKWQNMDFALQEVAGGVLRGKVIALDSEASYDFSQLQQALELAGAKVHVFSGEEAERISSIRALNPDFLLSFSLGEMAIGHFPRSTRGRALGEQLAVHFKEVYSTSVKVEETRNRIILRATGDALLVELPSAEYIVGKDGGYNWFVALWKLFGGQGSVPSRGEILVN